MNPLLQMAINAALKYLESHPDQVELLVTALLDFLSKEAEKALAAAAK